MSEGTCTITVSRQEEHPCGHGLESVLKDVEVVYEYHREEPATRWYPGCGESVEIQSTSIPLTTEEEQRAEQACWIDVRKRQKEAKRP